MNIDLFNANKNYVYGEQLVTLVDEFIGIIEENGKEFIVLPGQCEDYGYKVEEFKTGKQYVFCKELIPKHLGELSGWENEIDRKPVKFENKLHGYCWNDEDELYTVFPAWCREV